MSDRDREMNLLREQRDDAIDRMVKAELKLTGIKAMCELLVDRLDGRNDSRLGLTRNVLEIING